MSVRIGPALRWHGGKARLAPQIIRHFPEHDCYVEGYGGAASVLFHKRRSKSEVYNDLDEDVVNFFQVLRDPASAARLIDLLELTPYARAEFDSSRVAGVCRIERARQLAIRSYMGFGSDSAHSPGKTGFRARSAQSNKSPERTWRSYPKRLFDVVDRLRGVVIECQPACDVMRRHDGPATLHFVDPPYLPETRSGKKRKGGEQYHSYAHEMTAADHLELLAFLRTLSGMVVLCGYPSPMYDDALKDWDRVEMKALADGAKPRTEVLWINRAAASQLQGQLFAAA